VERSVRQLAGLIALLLLYSTPSSAERPPTRFDLKLGAFAPRLDTSLRLDSANGMVGVELDLEGGFNLSDFEVVPVVSADYWISKKHGLNLFAFDLSRNSTGESTVEFRFGDKVFPANVPLSVRMDTQVIAFTYSYKFFNSAKRSFGLNAGFNVNRIDAGIATETGVSIEESGSVTAPLPVLGVNGHVVIAGKWHFYGTVGVFGLTYLDYSGVLSTLSAGFFHQTFKNVGFGIGYYGFRIRIDSENEDFLGRFEYSYAGPTGYLTVRF
jgi:hypothetical protein